MLSDVRQLSEAFRSMQEREISAQKLLSQDKRAETKDV